MAKPRVFVSSTYFDLRVVRADLERFIKEIGYEPVLFERGQVPYGNEDSLETYCYREITNCDILISIIGGKYGSPSSKEKESSISQKELKTAIGNGKQVYIFAERAVFFEYRIYLNNKDVQGFKPSSVNDIRIFKFLEEIYGVSSGNPVEPFETSDDITKYLKEQWAGLFQRLLQEVSRQKEINIIENLNTTAQTLKTLVTFLTEESKGNQSAIKEILLSTHPAFDSIKRVAQISYRVVFYNLAELNSLLSARQYEMQPYDEEEEADSVYFVNSKAQKGIRVNRDVFDENWKLKIISPVEWSETNIEPYEIKQMPVDEDIPF